MGRSGWDDAPVDFSSLTPLAGGWSGETFLADAGAAGANGGSQVFVSPEWLKTFWGSIFDIDYIADRRLVGVGLEPLSPGAFHGHSGGLWDAIVDQIALRDQSGSGQVGSSWLDQPVSAVPWSRAALMARSSYRKWFSMMAARPSSSSRLVSMT